MKPNDADKTTPKDPLRQPDPDPPQPPPRRPERREPDSNPAPIRLPGKKGPAPPSGPPGTPPPPMDAGGRRERALSFSRPVFP